jgi:two-component system LytT family response regulator
MINLLNQYFLLKKHLKIAAGINNTIENSQASLKDSTDAPSDFDKQNNLSKETLNQHTPVNLMEFEVDKFKKVQIEVTDLIYVEALGNYVNIVYERNGIKKITIRETINKIEQKISLSKMIYKPHRSYLVNLHYISNVTADAQGLKIHFKDIGIAIPVSRNKIKEFRLLTSSRI